MRLGSARKWIGISGTLTFVGVFMSTFTLRASAECGDYVHVGSFQLPGTEWHSQLVMLAQSAEHSKSAPNHQLPCRGPGCSSRDPVPCPTGPTAAFTASPSQWAALMPAAAVSKPAACAFHELAISDLPDSFIPPFERPPRAA